MPSPHTGGAHGLGTQPSTSTPTHSEIPPSWAGANPPSPSGTIRAPIWPDHHPRYGQLRHVYLVPRAVPLHDLQVHGGGVLHRLQRPRLRAVAQLLVHEEEAADGAWGAARGDACGTG